MNLNILIICMVILSSESGLGSVTFTQVPFLCSMQKRLLTVPHGELTNILVGTGNSSSGGTNYDIQSFIVHPRYDSFRRTNDLALVKVGGFIKYSSSVQPIELARSVLDFNIILSDWTWGMDMDHYASERLNTFRLETISCLLARPLIDIRKQACIRGQDLLDRHEDTGGPLTYSGKLVGVVSFGIPYNVSLGYAGVFTELYHYNKWITDSMV